MACNDLGEAYGRSWREVTRLFHGKYGLAVDRIPVVLVKRTIEQMILIGLFPLVNRKNGRRALVLVARATAYLPSHHKGGLDFTSRNLNCKQGLESSDTRPHINFSELQEVSTH